MSTNFDARFLMFNPGSLMNTTDSFSQISNNSNSNSNIYSNSKKSHPRSTFTENEDKILRKLVKKYGTYDWQLISNHLPGRNPRQCRDRWKNYLSPEVVNGPWTKDEERLLVVKYEEFGPCWKKIAEFFPTRSDINIKSRWNMMQRRLQKEDLQIKKEMFMQKYGQKGVSPLASINIFPVSFPLNIVSKHLVQQMCKTAKQSNIKKSSASKKNNSILQSNSNKSVNEVSKDPEPCESSVINSSPLPFLSEGISNEKIFMKEDIFNSNSNDCLNSMLMKEELTNVFDLWF